MGQKQCGLPGLYRWWDRWEKSGEVNRVYAKAAKFSSRLVALEFAAGDLTVRECGRELVQDTWIFIHAHQDGSGHWNGAVSEFTFFCGRMKEVVKTQLRTHANRRRLRNVISATPSGDDDAIDHLAAAERSELSPPTTAISLYPDPETPLHYKDFKAFLASINSTYPRIADLLVRRVSKPRELAARLNISAKSAGRMKAEIFKLLIDYMGDESTQPRRRKENKDV